jgi:hypothetical protein
MKTYQKIAIGGLGALTPIVMNFLATDAGTTLQNLTPPVFLGYAIRVVCLFYLGGIIAFLHKDEGSPLKLFELGIAAPALITALLNAANVPKPPPSPGGTPSASITLIRSAHAQTPKKEEVKTFSRPKETPIQQFYRGFTGTSPDRVWFVIAGSHRQVEDAEKQVKQITQNDKWKEFKGEVYAPYGGNPYYAVVIGAHLTYTEAQQVLKRAVAAGLPKDTYLWTFPK